MINVDVYVPALDTIEDFELDETVPVSQILHEMTEILSKCAREESTGDFLLCLPEEQRILSLHMTLQMCGVKNGDRLMFI